MKRHRALLVRLFAAAICGLTIVAVSGCASADDGTYLGDPTAPKHGLQDAPRQTSANTL